VFLGRKLKTLLTSKKGKWHRQGNGNGLYRQKRQGRHERQEKEWMKAEATAW
jgi:hypothetical protein